MPQTHNNVHLVIDGDILAFKASAANEKRHIIATHKVSGEQVTEQNRTRFKASQWRPGEWDIVDVQEEGPLPFAQKMATDMIDKWLAQSGASSFEIVLSGPNNFRLNLPLPKQYKSNRNGALRPVQLTDMKQWLKSKYSATVTDGYEADDYLSMLAYSGEKSGQKVVQCTIDKDADGYTGWVLNMDKDEPVKRVEGFGSVWLSEDRKIKGIGTIWMLTQSVFGDSSDGYFPKDLSGQKFGDVECYNMLKDCKTFKDALDVIYKQYIKWYHPSGHSEPVTYTAWDGTEHTKDAVDIWQMYVDCAHMQRWVGDRIDIRKVLGKHGIAC